MKSTIFWNVTPCSLIAYYRSVGGTHCLNIFGRRINEAAISYSLCSCWYFTGLYMNNVFHTWLILLLAFLAHSFTVKIDAVNSSETSVRVYRTALSHSINITVQFILVFGVKCTVIYMGSVFLKEAFAFYKLWYMALCRFLLYYMGVKRGFPFSEGTT
jgi:hypothetical protein